MPLPTVSFLLGLLVLAYLFTFVVFALLRFATGVSIQRVGYSGFRHVSFAPRHGIDVAVRGIGISVHRPTFALPTWCSLVITELVVTVDLQALGKSRDSDGGLFEKSNGHAEAPHNTTDVSGESNEQTHHEHRSTWETLLRTKETLKRLHSKIAWIRLVDLVAVGTRLNVVGVGCIQVERVSLSVDTRVKTVDRSRLFQHHQTKPESQAPAEWKSLIRSVLFTPDTGESTEVLDYATINIHGILHNELQGLRDTSLALKLGRLNVPYDDIEHAQKCADLLRGKYAQPNSSYASSTGKAFVCDKTDANHGQEQDSAQAKSDSKEFVASVLRGVQEVQFAIGFFGCSKRMDLKTHSGQPVYLNVALKEFGLDVLRLDPKSPAHRMYFSSKDVAHQGLLTAIAISAGINDGHEHPERMLYVPMVTATVKTTLLSRTVHYRREDDARNRNTNMLYANFVCTSPSVDLDPKHLPLVREVLVRQTAPKTQPLKAKPSRRQFIFKLLPKAYIKLAVQEPVIRVSLPPMDKFGAAEDDFDLLISSGSTMSLELESSHVAEDNIHYNLATKYQHTGHHVYYQTHIGERHDLLHSETVELQVDVSAAPELSVVASGRLQTFTCFMVRPEICGGVRQIMRQLRKDVLARNDHPEVPRPSFLRNAPMWLTQCRIEGSDFGAQLAGVDQNVSKDTRGAALQLESWAVEYKAHREDQPDMFTRRNSIGRGTLMKEETPHVRERSPRRRFQSLADGRRLTLHLTNLEGFVIDSVLNSEPNSFLAMPKFEVAFSTRTDNNGPLFHINSYARSVRAQYSLYNYYAICLALNVVRTTFLDTENNRTERQPRTIHKPSSLRVPGSDFSNMDEVARHEVTVLDFKSNMLQLKGTMPADPPMMIQIFGVETGRHRWGHPFAKFKLGRLYVRAPSTKSAWARIVLLKTLRFDLRDFKRVAGQSQPAEKSIDLVVETIRVAVPHSLVVHSIFDNITNIKKTTKQLNHNFKTGSNDHVVAKEPEGPINVPRITLRAQLFLFDLEDSGFEWKLNAIYRAGLMEQKQRIAREEAFKIKEKRLTRGGLRTTSRLRASSANPENRSRSRNAAKDVNSSRRSRSSQPTPRPSPPQHQQAHTPHRRRMRYDADGTCGISDTSQLTIDAARDRLNHLNAQSWKNRIDYVIRFQSNAIREIRSMFWGLDELPDDAEQEEPVLALNHRPALMIATMTDLGITIDRPSFPIDQYPRFLHDVGKGMPHDMEYSVLVPINLQVSTSEIRFQLRDYPLPLLHVPPLGSRQSPRLPSLSLRTDFVIAEEFRDHESQRQVEVRVIPPSRTSNGQGLDIVVQRTISPVKTYSDMKIEINTSNPTKITWGTSYQPAIQDAMQVIEGFTKPSLDPSDRVGFWDKIRLSFHSRVNVAWKGDGDVHLALKGSRDPYVVTGQGAGLVMVWRNDVRWNIAQSQDPREFMTVDSSDYVLAVPDFNSYARRSQESDDDDDSSLSASSSSKRDAVFKKVVMKLSGNVRWVAGLMFDREIQDGKRSFDFKPHYDVVLKHPDFAKPLPDGSEFDAFRDFRSSYIHMSIAIAAPYDRQWTLANPKPSNNYNAIHLTPRFFSHFFSWWSMFSGVMALPIRQGPLWGAMEKKSKKFGRHVATIKYNLLLSPLYVSHVYKHKDAEDYKENVVSATGLKMRLDSFMLDIHQRREFFYIHGHDGAHSKQSSGLRIHKAQLDFINANLRALSASITGTSVADIDKAGEDVLASLHGQVPSVDMSKFHIPDNDFDWVDMDDFVELDWILPAESDPQTKILPLGYCPRFTYFRQTDHDGVIAGDSTRTSPFGEEPTHKCVMSARNDPRRVQVELIQKRLGAIREHKSHNTRMMGEQELKIVQQVESDKATKDKLQEKMNMLQSYGDQLQAKSEFLENMLKTLKPRIENDDPTAVPDLETSEEFFEAEENVTMHTEESANLHTAPLADFTSDFNNRFIVHNAQIKWNNSLRNIILRYIHQNSQRRGFVYYMSQRAVKFLLDINEERKKAEASRTTARNRSQTAEQTPMSPNVDDDETVQERINQLLSDGRAFVNADEVTGGDIDVSAMEDVPKDDISVEYAALNTYHIRLIAPQIQLQSEKNPKAAVLFTAKNMQLKVVQIMDKDRVSDDVSGLVQRRFTVAADSLQMFVTTVKTFKGDPLYMYMADSWGAERGTFWPPWMPMEIIFDFRVSPYGFQRVVDQTSVSIRYDKYNQLRLKYNDDVSGGEQASKGSEGSNADECRKDHIWIEFPRLRAICDSGQYFALYIIVMDLLLYNEPLEKTRSERLEKIMLASDFSDLSGTPEMVMKLQERIRQLEEIKYLFQVNERYLDRQGWKDRIAMDQDLAGCEDELFFMMKAITTSQRRAEDRREHDDVTGLLHLNVYAKEIVWHLIRDKGESLMELQLRHAAFDRTVNNDGSNHNVVEIGRIHGLNLLPEAIYPEIIAPFVDESRGIFDQKGSRMLRVHWLMLEAIAGIPVVENFEINLVPLKLQIERDVARRVFEYVFPGHNSNEGGGFSPFMVRNMLPTQKEDEDDDGDDDASTIHTPVPPPDEAPEYPIQSIHVRGPASLESRLKPTTHLQNRKHSKGENKGLGISHFSHNHGFAIFHHSDKDGSKAKLQQPRSNASRQALAGLNTGSTMSLTPSERSIATGRSEAPSSNADKKKPFSLRRSHSYERTKDKDKEQPDDLTEMINRASSYMTLAFVKIPSVVLCLSYRGQGKRNIEDVHDFVFRMPTLEYRNKTWSNLDLALQLKKDVIRALISHFGAIVSNKFSHHRPNKQQIMRLREMANMSTSFSPSASGFQLDSPNSSNRNGSASTQHSGRPSTASTRPTSLSPGLYAHSTPSASSMDLSTRPGSSRTLDGQANGHVYQERRSSLPQSPQRSSAMETSEHDDKFLDHSNQVQISRARTLSISRHLPGFGERRRQKQAESTANGSTEDTEENRRKSKLLLGGQKLLRTLRD